MRSGTGTGDWHDFGIIWRKREGSSDIEAEWSEGWYDLQAVTLVTLCAEGPESQGYGLAKRTHENVLLLKVFKLGHTSQLC